MFTLEEAISHCEEISKTIQGDNKIQFKYKIEYTINNIKYYDTIDSESFNLMQPLKIGDTKTIVIQSNIFNKNYKCINGDYKELSAKSKNGNLAGIFLICFFSIIGFIMLYGIDKSIEK